MSKIVQTSPAELREALAQRAALLIDVREPSEFAAERIPGALLYPLSTFDPQAVPNATGRKLVIQCAAGGRSMRAAQALVAAGHPEVHNLEGGINAWKAQGLPLVRVNPATGQVLEQGKV
ncbi:MAG TPA: rhodanese-like domain-containing protein [Steroidobacteraceae bacterium]|nr:rhodanese-like domain-containing protein [Steroidobacteraceae bacterium]